ncbi:MAG: hypothetical protein AMJ62_11085 [Myxococcales bacterium SG8_38]|nr:MAG: hypothetical protein AMJ62_11085 [Myxococcales bacterium SG8_38]
MEWRKNRVAIGAVAFFVLLALTLWSVNRRSRQPETDEALPSVELDKDSITTLEITRSNDERVVLSQVDGQWRVTSPLDAPADQSNVESALSRLADLKIARLVASQPQNYARLQVDDANAVQVVAKSGDKTLADLKIGKYANGMTMLRVGDREQVFGASGSLRYAFDRELKAWRNRKVVSVESADVQSIRVRSKNGTFELEREQDGWKAVDAPKTLQKLDPQKVSSLVSMAARLTASDFAPEDVSAARAGLTEPTAEVTINLKDESQPIVLELGDATDDGSEHYLRRRDDPTIYVISKYMADRLHPDANALEVTEEKETAASPPSPAQGREPPPQLPPEVMKQLQDQIKAQQQQQR